MQKKLLKLSTIIGIILLVSMLILSVECFAVPTNNTTSASDIVVGEDEVENDEEVSNEVDSEENEDTYWDETIDGEDVDSEDENAETLLDEEAEVTEEDAEDEVYTDTTTTTSSSNNDIEDKIPSKIGSYSTGSTLPEANLGLNNILNIILIAVGAIIILLAIAILIRLKH